MTGRLLRPGEACKRLGIHFVTLKRWIYSGKIKAIKFPTGRWMIPEEEVEKILGTCSSRFSERICGCEVVNLAAYQSRDVQEIVLKHLEKFERMTVVGEGKLFRWEEFDEIFEIAEKLEREGFKLTLDVPLMRLGSPIYGGYIYAYDMDRRDELLELAEKLGREIRILPGKPLEKSELENLFLDCLAAGLHYDYHAIWLWLRFEDVRKYRLLATPELVEYVLEAERALMRVNPHPAVDRRVLEKAVRELVSRLGFENLVFIGAVAVYAHLGYVHRGTGEIDVIYLGSREDLEKALDYRVMLKVPKPGGGMEYRVHGVKVDLYLEGRPIGGLQIDDIVRNSVVRQVFGVKVRVPSLKHLIAMKKSSRRRQDLSDLKALLRGAGKVGRRRTLSYDA